MVWSSELMPRQDGRIAFITGANSGLGFATAQALVEKGATVILGCRSLQKAQQARKKLLTKSENGHIEVLAIDLADLENVSLAIDYMVSKYQKLDLLINNAGVMAPPRTVSKQGFEIQLAVNHLSHMALTLMLLPLLSKQLGARVVTVSSGAQYMGKINWDDLQGAEQYDRWASYSQSKLANVMFALELNERLKSSNLAVASLSAHPGLARTNLQSNSVKSNGSWQEALAYKLMNPLFQSSSMGSLPQLLAAIDPSAQGGEQYGPQFNFRGYPKLCQIARSALNKQDRERLWNVSYSLIKDFVNINNSYVLSGHN